MPKDFTRSDRVADQIQRELAELIRLELKDPRVGFVTLTGVEVTRDMSHAKVFYTLMKGDEAETQATLDRSSGWLRSQLGKRIKLFKMPELHFHYDRSVEYGMSLDKLIDQAMEMTGSDKPADADDADKAD
ncbi:30S ribosome-binding factor RbfA [Chitinimonas sp. BJYL2]|uniref:30S ribosome-binding factor RbfA n=1 Tax=Chitinimonas sp. BJYL2 TaxID=2976696 RepID=UPI0022B53605|nr:30S ribosome-binding factor RbfA [Chitinimonas sp. BJYL2]